ncbi:dephospho-CoA kinase [Ascidiimonas aurantiaca]|uniref:dephospho-CoA kinase n=1 Tax=Ascidiimonas aurantiaca TaxID=1685432 RepID=UPI0030ED563F
MIVGLTGGIGSGKSTVAGFFQEMGVPVFIADEVAKTLLADSAEVIKKVKALLGTAAYKSGVPDRKYIAGEVFADPDKLKRLNKIIHPEVRKKFDEWYKKQPSPYVIKEAAILFESGGAKECDLIITVTAPMETRIDRVITRDGVSREAVLARMKNQWSDEEKIKLSDFTIVNTDIEETRRQIEDIHGEILGCIRKI